jgi:hypothetical protein
VIRRVPADEQPRDEALVIFRRRRDAVKGAGVNYWLFEDLAGSGEFTEFYEGPDPDVLRGAVAAAMRSARVTPHGDDPGAQRFLTAVEL